MREGTTSRVTAADRPYGELYDFYSISPENFGSTLIFGVMHNDFHMSSDGLNHSLTVNNNQKWSDKTSLSFCKTTEHKRTKSIID